MLVFDMNHQIVTKKSSLFIGFILVQLHFFSDAAVITLNVTEVQTENKIVLLFYFCVDYIISQMFIMNAHSAFP